ncbi:MAG TPA: hypothetical protein V6D17_23245 [Candidatus Obscuribacterales bacterium]
MSNKKESTGINLPLAGMVFAGVLSALIVGASFDIIKYWPQPQSVEPYFGFETGIWWGLIAGGVVGLVIGYLTDDSHFSREER